MKPKRWQDWVNVILGAWMVVSPWVLGFTGHEVAARSAWVLGAAIIVFAGIGAYIHESWEEAVNIILGLCLAGSPWALGFADQQNPTANAAIVGVLVLGLGLWAMLGDLDLKRWREEHRKAQQTR